MPNSNYQTAEEALRERVQLAALRADVSAALVTDEQEWSAVSHQCVEALVTHLDAAFARIWMVEEGTDVLVPQASAAACRDFGKAHTHTQVGESRVGQVARSGQTLVVNDVGEDTLADEDGKMGGQRAMAFAGFPLVLQGRVLGVMEVFTSRRLPDTALTELAPIADGIAQWVQRKRAEEALRANVERLRVALDAARLGIFLWYPDGDRVIWENDRIYEIFERDPRDGPINAAEFAEKIVHPEDLESFKSALERTVKTGERFYFQGRYRRRDESYGWIEFTGQLSKPREGAVRVLGSVQEITPRKLAEERERLAASEAMAIAEANAKYRTFFDQGTLFAALLSLDGTVVEVNRLCLEACGFSRGDVVGKKFWECGWWGRSPALVEMVRAGSQLALGGEIFRQESEFFVADGSRRFMDLVIAPVKDEAGRVLFLAPTGTDVTERKRAEEALRESQAALEFTLASAQIGDWDLDLVHDTSRRSLRHDRCFGYTEAIPEGEWGYEQFIQHVHPEDRARVDRDFKAATTQLTEWQMECRIVWPDGSIHWISTHGSVYRTASGRATRMLGIVADITERKLAEQALRESKERITNIFESITDGFAAVDRDWRFTYLNQRATVILRPVLGDDGVYLGKNLWEEFPDLRDTVIGDHYRRSVAEQVTVQFETYYPPLEGWFEVRAYPSKDGLSIYFQDITVRKQAEEAVAQLTAQSERQRRLYETILLNTPDLIYVFDLDHRFTYANHALLTMWGRTFEDAIGKTCLELGYEPWHAAMHDREIDQVIATKRPVRGEVPFDGANGRRVYDYIFVPVLGAGGEVEAIGGTTRDITDRKAVEEELRESRERLQAALDGSGAGTFRWDIQTNRLEWDENLDRHFGLPPGEKIRSLENFIAAVHPEERAEVIARCARCASEGVDFDMEYRVMHPDGTVRWLDDKGKTFFDAAGRPLYMAGMCLDITERKLAQQWESSQRRVLELIAQDASLPAVFDAVARMIEAQSTHGMRASILVLDEDRLHLRHGAAPNLPEGYVRAIDGLAIGENVGSCGSAAFLQKPVYVADIAHDPRWKDYAALAAEHHLAACWSTPIFSSAGELLGTFAMYYAGVREPNETDLRLVEVATRTVAIAIERRRSEAEVRASAERLRFMAESMPQKIFGATATGEGVYFNKQWIDFTGLTFEQLRGSGWVQAIHPEDREEFMRRWQHSVQTGDSFQMEHRVCGADGVSRWHLTRAHAMRDAEGRVQMWIGSNTDIDDARRAMEEISRASRAKDDFLAALSHELRTPLTPVLMTAAALEGDPTLTAEIREQLAMMRRNVELEARLIDDLLDLTRISRGKLHIVPVAADVHELISHTAEIVRSDGHGKQVRIVFQFDATRHYVLADPTRLQQVFWNLIKNALKFTPTGGTITVRTQNDAENWVAICVEDTGIGIAAEALPHIFKAFEQGDAAGQHRYGGLGLGLAISEAIVAVHGGQIRAESEGPDRGAKFTVTLATVDAPATAGGASQPHPAKSRALRLLIVEDHEATRTVLRRLLQRDGHKVTTAATVTDALAAFSAQPFDAVVSDLGLPDGSGFDLMREIQRRRPVPAIALSGYGMEEDVRQTRDAGFSAHLVKPVNLDQLRVLLDQVPQEW